MNQELSVIPAEQSAENKRGLTALRADFPATQISKLPKPTSRDGTKKHCDECGGYHSFPAIHLDYVGHAAVTHRLLDTDIEWNWEPLAFDANGLPLLDAEKLLWIKLTVCGVTRIGVGDAQGKVGGDAMKERIGDALRNASMRFGVALGLWSKADLDQSEQDKKPATSSASSMVDFLIAQAKKTKSHEDARKFWANTNKLLVDFPLDHKRLKQEILDHRATLPEEGPAPEHAQVPA